MQADWSVIINVLLLIGIFMAIIQVMKTRRNRERIPLRQPGVRTDSSPDEIIAVRKVPLSETPEEKASSPTISAVSEPAEHHDREPQQASLLMFLLAKENREFAGFELLQTILAAGLRFGEGHFFHRHQHLNGQGPVLCSLAAATASGVFDLQNIGAFSVRGLCLFMQASGNAAIDGERFSIMLETAQQLSRGLDAHLLDENRQPLTEKSIERYQTILNIQ